MPTTIGQLNSIPLKEIRDRAFLGLNPRKSMKPKVQNIRFEDARRRVPEPFRLECERLLPDQSSQRNAYRWFIAGLEAKKAIRKALVDLMEEGRLPSNMQRIGRGNQPLQWRPRYEVIRLVMRTEARIEDRTGTDP